MPVSVADRSSNKEEQIVHAAEVIGRSKHRAAVFRAVYTGKKRIKKVSELMDSTGLNRNRVLDAGRHLADNDLLHAVKTPAEIGYEKIDFFQRYRDRILRLSTDKQKREAIPTKRRPHQAGQVQRLKVELKLTKSTKAKQITIDDVASFSAVKRTKEPEEWDRIPEVRFRKGMAAILGERTGFKDWGGELRDLSSTRLKLKDKRLSAAFAFKGPATKGKLTPAKMGKNGDQIQRLFKCPSTVFVVQYQGEVDDSVYEQMSTFAQLRAYLTNEPVYWMVIDEVDSRRLIESYPKRFE